MDRNFSAIFRRILTILPGFLILIFLTSAVPSSLADNDKEKIAYKLAILYTKAENPEDAFLKKPITPTSAVISEFQWILDSLKSRCLNPENVLADTIVENWKTFKSTGQSITLLETARELLIVARNASLSDNKKVNFRMTSRHWLKNKLGETNKASKKKRIPK